MFTVPSTFVREIDLGAVERKPDARLSCDVKDRVEAFLREQVADERMVSDVSFDEHGVRGNILTDACCEVVQHRDRKAVGQETIGEV